MKAPPAAPLSPAEITRRSGSNFLVSFSSLEEDRRSALTAIYAFCRVVDDAADECDGIEEGRAQLAFWGEELERSAKGTPETELGRALQAAIRRYCIPPGHLREVVEGVKMDLEAVRYADLAALEVYCHKVAAAVGLACLPVFGVERGESTACYAEQLGQALQLTNVLRDLRADADLGRVYVPEDLLAEEGVERAWLAGGGPAAVYRPGGPMHRLVQRLARLAHRRFEAAETALHALPCGEQRKLLAPQIMAAVYFDLLLRIERRGGDLRRRARVPSWRKLLLVWRTRRRVRA